MQTLLDDLDIIELYQQPGKAHHLSEITKKQMALYDAMRVATRNRYNFTGLQALRTLGPKGRQPSRQRRVHFIYHNYGIIIP